MKYHGPTGPVEPAGPDGDGSGPREKNLFSKRTGSGLRVLTRGSGSDIEKPDPNPTRCHSYTEVPAGVEKEKNGAVVVSRTEEKAKEKGKGKEKAKNKADANPSEDALTIGDMVSKVKAAESKFKIDSEKDSH